MPPPRPLQAGSPTLLVANRGEVALRVERAAADLGWRSVAVFSSDDESALHVRRADEAVLLPGTGPAAYLDAGALLAAAARAGATHLHPGYGFLSESADLARGCRTAGVTFVGPAPDTLERLGDKAAARALAQELRLPVAPGTAAASVDDARRFMGSLGGAPVVVKAVAGGGGRGMRVVRHLDQMAQAHAAARAEARASFGLDDVYVEALVEGARHIEVQVVGDGVDVAHLWERDCSLQRRHQKLLELAPAPALPQPVRERLLDAALRLAGAVSYRGVGTVEFLVAPDGRFFFLEANPRLQVEHTVTEELAGIDLVAAQLRLAVGATLDDLGLGAQARVDRPPPPGMALQLRINAETVAPDGRVTASAGTLTAFDPPTGPGIRVDTHALVGYSPALGFDTLLAKLVVSGSDAATVRRRAARAAAELVVEGVETNLALHRALLQQPGLLDGEVTTTWLEDRLPDLVDRSAGSVGPATADSSRDVAERAAAGDGTTAVRAPTTAVVTVLDVAAGAHVRAGQQLAVLEAMKMHFPVEAETAGTVRQVLVRSGQTVREGQPLLVLEPVVGSGGVEEPAATAEDLDAVRADLREVQHRWALTRDEARPAAVEKRRSRGERTARENVAALLDDGSFTEYGAFAVAAQRARRSEQELLERSPADGLVTGVGTVGAHVFGRRATCAVAAYDYTVFAGTQGYRNHAKLDRLVELADRWRWPLVLFAEGGGGRPGDTDTPWASALAVPTFARFAGLSGRVPLVGVVNGNCFAGNAALLGCCDVVIATRSASIGMGGPAMVEGGGLGVFRPEEIGPVEVQSSNGVVDVLVEDEEQAVEVARRYLGYFQGDLPQWTCADQRLLRALVPQERKQVYDVRRVLATLADDDTVLELRPGFARGMVTALVRVEGRPLGVLANDPRVLGGAVTADGSDKAARMLNLCEAHRLPVLSLVDTPGFMVGPDSERQAAVRRMSRLFLRAANLTVPVFSVALRRGYGLGAMAMTGGQFHSPALHVSWPTGEFGGMGLEGAVRLAMRRELEAIADPEERERTFEQLVAAAYATGRAVNVAAHLEIDAVIDPAETRSWLTRALRSAPVPDERRPGTYVDSW